jgi:hypothetical protein
MIKKRKEPQEEQAGAQRKGLPTVWEDEPEGALFFIFWSGQIHV